MNCSRSIFSVVGLIVLSALAGPVQAADDGDSRLLTIAEGGQEDLQVLWRSLATGDGSVLNSVDSGLFRAPHGRSPENPGVTERWTMALTRTIAKLGNPEVAQAALDRHLRREQQSHAANQWPALAVHFLPAPHAVHLLSQEASRRFDHGDFAAYFRLYHLLSETQLTPHPLDQSAASAQRLKIATENLDQRDSSPWWQKLPMPGPVRPMERSNHWQPQQTDGGPWAVEQGHLLALDPFGQVRWQRSLERRAHIWTDHQWALSHSPHGLWLIHWRGAARQLTMPKDIKPLGLIGGFAWFAQGQTIYRLDPQRDTVSQLQLPSQAVALPVVRGAHSLWLGADEYFLFHDGRLSGRYLHGLEAKTGWELQTLHDPHGIAAALTIYDPLGDRHWQITAFPEDSSPVLRPGHLNRAGRHSEALAAWQSLDETQRRSASIPFAVSLAALGRAAEWTVEEALQWIDDPHWRLRAALALLGTQPAESHHRLLLRRLALASPESLLPNGADHLPLHPVSRWPQVISAHTLAQVLEDNALPFPPNFALGEPQPHAADTTVETLQRHRAAGEDTRLFLGEDELQLHFGPNFTEISRWQGPTSDQRLRWRLRWPTISSLPGRSIDARSGVIIVGEGQSRLYAINAESGRLLGQARVPNGLAMPSQSHYLSHSHHEEGLGHFAILHPIAVNNQLTVVSCEYPPGSQTRPLPRPETINLAQTARWALAVGPHLLVAEHSGQVRLFPGGEAIHWPGDIPTSAPSITAQGLVYDSRLWPWADDAEPLP